MADITLTAKESYTFGRYNPYGAAVYTFITNGTDRAQKLWTLRNGLNIRNPNDGVDAYMSLQTTSTGKSEFNIRATTGDPYISFDPGGSGFSVGIDNSDSDSFKITRSQILNPLIECLKIDTSEQVYLPNINTGAGTFPVKWQSGGQLTYDTSTAKTKENIVNANVNSYNDVLQLQPREFNYRKSSDTNTYLGLIAEEAAVVNPLFADYGQDVEWDDSGKHSGLISDEIVPVNINERAIITALIGKIQDLEQRIQQLENK